MFWYGINYNLLYMNGPPVNQNFKPGLKLCREEPWFVLSPESDINNCILSQRRNAEVSMAHVKEGGGRRGYA